MIPSSIARVLFAFSMSLGFERCRTAQPGVAVQSNADDARTVVEDSSAAPSGVAPRSTDREPARSAPLVRAERRVVGHLFEPSMLARLNASAPTSRLSEIRRGLALCGLRYDPPSSRTSTGSRWVSGLATGGLTELVVRSNDVDFFAPDLRLDAQFGAGPTVVANARDVRNSDLVAVTVEQLERGSMVNLALFDRDTFSADDELVRRAVRWDGERTIAVASRVARVSCRLIEWASLLPLATSALRDAERAAPSLASRAERVAGAIGSAQTAAGLLDASFDAELSRAEQALTRASSYAVINPEWSEFSRVSGAVDRASQPVRTARLARVRRGFHEPTARDRADPYVTGQCVEYRPRVSFELARDPAPSRVVGIDWSGHARPLTGAVRLRRGIRTFVASGQARRPAERCEAPLAIVVFSGRTSVLRAVNGGATAP
ncbi:MAG: hypothetical protein JNK05_30105 [Myxococcales bacterium]|nr:hypothetical protein [Myxococcales bacterium]